MHHPCPGGEDLFRRGGAGLGGCVCVGDRFHTAAKINKQGFRLEQISYKIACWPGKDTSLSLLSLERGGKGKGLILPKGHSLHFRCWGEESFVGL